MSTQETQERQEAARGPGAASATLRSRAYRDKKRRSGGMELSIFIGPRAAAALSIIRAHDHCTQSSALEKSLIARALVIAPDARTLNGCIGTKMLDGTVAQVWIDSLHLPVAARVAAKPEKKQ